MHGRRVVITGIGVVSPIGIGAAPFWKGLTGGQNGIGPISSLDASKYNSRIAAECTRFNAADFMHPKKAARMARATKFGVASSKMAVKDAGLDIGKENPDRWTIITGTSASDFEPVANATRTLLEEGLEAVDPAEAPPSIQIHTAAAISVELRFTCEINTMSAGCCSGGYALGQGLRLIRSGEVDAAIVGGTEAPIIPTILALLSNGHALSERNDSPSQASRPFDRNRDGYVLGEGAAFFVLEEAERAKARGARIYAELAGYGATSDAFSLVRMYPGQTHMGRAMRKALDDAKIDPQRVDTVNAHGSSSVVPDRRETLAIKEVLGNQAYKAQVTSVKSMVGQAIAAGVALQAAAASLSTYHGALSPTINYTTPDPDCDLDYVPNTARESVSRVTLVNSMGMGGANSSLVLVHAGKVAPKRVLVGSGIGSGRRRFEVVGS